MLPVLLIVPRGIEIQFLQAASTMFSDLLIVPRGIEMYEDGGYYSKCSVLLIVPRGIEITNTLSTLISFKYF